VAIRIVTDASNVPRALDATATAAKLDAVGEEDDVGTLIEEVTDEVERCANLRLWYREYEEVVQGGGTDKLYLSARPVVSVTSPVTHCNDDEVDEGTEDGEFRIWPDFLSLPCSTCATTGSVGPRYFGTPAAAGWLRGDWTVQYFGGWYLPSMDDPVPTGAQRLEVGFPSLAGAIFDVVKTTWDIRQADPTLKRVETETTEIEFFGSSRIVAPRSALAVFAKLRREVV
jgi:hypothetical protein